MFLFMFHIMLNVFLLSNFFQRVPKYSDRHGASDRYVLSFSADQKYEEPP